MTRAFIEEETRKLLAEAFSADPLRAEECIEAVFGGPVFAWGLASGRQITALRRLLYTIVLEARG